MNNMREIEIHQVGDLLMSQRPQIGMYPHSEEGIKTLMKMSRIHLYDFKFKFTRFDTSSIEDILSDVVDLGNTDESLCVHLNRSISSGDIIVIDDVKYLVLPVGFREIA